MRFGVIAAAFVGLAVAIWLVLHIGIAAVFAAVTSVGPGGFALICLYGTAVVALMGSGWFALLPDGRGRELFICIVGRQMRDSAGDILPFSQFGGIVIGARYAILRGVAAPLSFASMVADVTTELMAQIAFIVIGLALGIAELRAAPAMAGVLNGLLLGTLLLVPGLAAFVFLQKRGSAFAERLAARFLPAALQHTAAFGRAMAAMYESPARLAASSTIHLLAWLASGVGIWISVKLIGGHLNIFQAIAIEAFSRRCAAPRSSCRPPSACRKPAMRR